jgi:hypothetical protein
MYTTSGFLRTMELILGMEPMTQYDAAATPAYAAFQSQLDLAPYNAKPARISLEEKNTADAYGARESMAMNFEEVNRIPMHQLNEILWKSIKGVTSPMPPPVRSAFIYSIEED